MPDLSAYQNRVSAETPDESGHTEAGDAETTDTEAASETVSVSMEDQADEDELHVVESCLLYTSPSPRDGLLSRMPSSA